MQNLKKNWLLVWKMTWEIWQIFTRARKSVKIGTLMGSFCPKYKIYELKIYRGAMCHDSEEWCKIWRGIRLVISKLTWGIWWILTWALENLKNLLFNWLVWPKYVMFELKNYRGVMFDDTKDWCKIWRKADLCFQKWHKEFGKFA